MRHTEQRGHAENLGQVRPETGEHEVGQQDILLHLPGDVIQGARVGKAEGGPALGERGVCILEGRGHGIVREEGRQS